MGFAQRAKGFGTVWKSSSDAFHIFRATIIFLSFQQGEAGAPEIWMGAKMPSLWPDEKGAPCVFVLMPFTEGLVRQW